MDIKKLAKKYKKAIIYFHQDLDGLMSAKSMQEYLKRYDIETIDCQPIQYGSLEYSISKPPSDDILSVLVDFSHGKSFIKIHTDHHDKQLFYDNCLNNFKQSQSNAETISSILSPVNIFNEYDIKIVNMIDSANFISENVKPEDIVKTSFTYDKTKTIWENNLTLGLVVNKLILTYKNKPNFLVEVIMNSKPSLKSMYNTIIKIIERKISNKEIRWYSPIEIKRHADEYYQQQFIKRKEYDLNMDFSNIPTGSPIKFGNCAFQIGSGFVGKAGMYDRYTIFRIYPEVKYVVIIWDRLGLIQVSKNPWDNEPEDINLGDIVINTIFKNKYSKYLYTPKYKISLLALKRYYESSIDENNENTAIGFDYNELKVLFETDYSDLTSKQQHVIEKWINWKKSQFTHLEYKRDKQGNKIYDQWTCNKNKEIDKAIKYLNYISIPLSDIILKTSGGHPAITNLSGFGLIEEQKKVNKAIYNGENPLQEKKITYRRYQEKYDSTSLKIMKSIAKDVMIYLNY